MGSGLGSQPKVTAEVERFAGGAAAEASEGHWPKASNIAHNNKLKRRTNITHKRTFIFPRGNRSKRTALAGWPERQFVAGSAVGTVHIGGQTGLTTLPCARPAFPGHVPKVYE